MAGELNFDIAPDELEIFLEDVDECLLAMESGILRLEKNTDADTINAVFRAAHSLKALAAVVGHRPMSTLTHKLETLFDAIREDSLSLTQALTDELLIAIDVLKLLREEIVNRQPSGADVNALLTRLSHLETGSEKPPVDSLADISTAPKPLDPDQEKQIETAINAGQNVVEVEVLANTALAPAARLYQVSLTLAEVGQVITQQPPVSAINEGVDRIWVLLATQLTAAEVEATLADVADLSEYEVQSYQPVSSQTNRKGKENGEKPAENLSERSAEKTVRISVERLDRLMNLVGELVTNRTRLLQIEDMLRIQYGKSRGVGALSDMVPHFSHVVDQLQEEVMNARMLPISTLFSKAPRLTRDAARKAGKQVNLVIEGETTELDRAVIEAIGDPFIHLLRNAVDHGIESPTERQAAGKPPEGTIKLTAESLEGQIVISIADDGQGIDPQIIGEAALRTKAVTEEELAQLSENEIIELIFQPNLTSTSEITEMSGRGVGLDVVRTNIERLSGSVVVMSEIGKGTTFRLTLPLTLALVQTMLVTISENLYAIPVAGINAALYLPDAETDTVRGRPVLNWNEEIVPLLDLRELFSNSRLVRRPILNGRKPSVVLVTWGKIRMGLIVDSIIGQQEIVVKSLNPLIGSVPGLSGATILGDGRIALIVDIPGLVNIVLQEQKQRKT